MFSKFFGKRDKAEEPVRTEKQPENANRGLQGVAPTSERRDATVIGPRAPAPVAPPVHKPSPVTPMQTAAYDKTRPMPLGPTGLDDMPSAEQSKIEALAVVELHHQRIANTIRTLWGYKECSVYINRLIMAGGDGMGHARVGFNQDAVQAMLTLSDLHDAEFGPPDSIPGGLLSL
jgi:hypothetical protein